MSIEAQIAALKNLAELDAELAVIDSELGTEREALESKRSSRMDLDAKTRAQGESIEEMERARSDLFAEIRQMEIQIGKAREKLARCRTEREVNAAQRELEELHRIHRDREYEIQKLVGLIDEAKQELDSTSQRRDSIASELGESEGSASQRITELETKRNELAGARADAAAQLDVSLQRKYDRVLKHRGTAIAAAVDGSCTACHIALPPMFFQQIMQRRALELCPSCHRILYFEPPTSEDGASAEAG